jgi:hypothetical protein
MYTRIDAIEDAQNRAETEAFNDRMQFAKFIEAGEHFAAQQGLIVGGAAATRLLLGDKVNPPAIRFDSFQYDLFSAQALQHARCLGETLYRSDPDGLGHYTAVVTKVTDYFMSILVDGRPLFNVTALPQFRGIRAADLIAPCRRPAQFAKSKDGAPLRLLCVSPEVQLISVYGALCNPANAGDWGDHLMTEAALRALFVQDARPRLPGKGSTTHRAPARICNRLLRDLLNKFAAGPSRVLVGSAAISLLLEEKTPTEGQLQVITAGRLESEAEEIVALAKASGAEVSWKIDDVKVPTEPRLQRLSLSVVVGGRREPIIEVYNAAEFDLVPYTTLGANSRLGPEAPPRTLKIGTPFVLMRYQLISLWTIQVLSRMGAVAAADADAASATTASEFNAVAKYYEATIACAASDPEAVALQLLPLTAYIGRLEEPELALRRTAQHLPGARFHSMYFPASRHAGSKK